MTDTATTSTTPAGTRRPFRALAIAVAVLLVAAGGFVLWREKFETYHLATVQEGVLYRDGNRNVREFANAVERVKPRTVVALVDDNEIADPKKPAFAGELKYLKDHGVKVERIPVKLGGWPTADDVRRFLSVVSDKQNQPVLVHCAQGVRRTGMMVAAFQEAVLGYDDAKAKQSILTFGHSQRTAKDVERFINGYDPKTGAVPEGLESGGE